MPGAFGNRAWHLIPDRDTASRDHESLGLKPVQCQNSFIAADLPRATPGSGRAKNARARGCLFNGQNGERVPGVFPDLDGLPAGPTRPGL
jgi:hypothetical protein